MNQVYDFCSDVHHWSTIDLENILVWMRYHAPITPSGFVDQIAAVESELSQRQTDEQEHDYQLAIGNR